MNSEIAAMVKPTPVDNSTRLEEYIIQASNLKLQGKSLYSRRLYLEASASLQMYNSLMQNMRLHNSASFPNYRRPMFQLSQEIPHMNNLILSCSRHLSQSNVPELLKVSLMPKSLKIPQMLIDEFIALSYSNTERDIETLGILAGYASTNSYEICSLILPRQQGCGDSCECLDDEGLFACLENNGWQVMGWIHTHPNHDLFLSSIDLHTHACYQWFFPESVAIVFAPTHPKQIATFRITTKGLETIRNCKAKGFHPHGREIYKEAQNVEFVSNSEFRKIDLRN